MADSPASTSGRGRTPGIVLGLACKSLLNRRLTATLTLLSVAMSVALLVGVERIRTEAKASFANTISGADLIVGARGGPLNLVLYSIFRMGEATNNISWESYQAIANRPEVAWTIPLSLGDAHRGFRVLGTDANYFEHYRFGRGQPLEFAEGTMFDDANGAVLGAEVAATLGYDIGEKIVVSHGIGAVSFEHHDEAPLSVVGVLAHTGTPVDRTVHVSLAAITRMHDEGGHDEHDHGEPAHDEAGQGEHGHEEAAHDEHDHDDHEHDEHGHDQHDHDEHGHPEHDHEEHGHDEHGHNETGHDEAGHNEHGHDEDGHDESGHDESSHDEHGHGELGDDDTAHNGHDGPAADHNGHDESGHDEHGHAEAGHDEHGDEPHHDDAEPHAPKAITAGIVGLKARPQLLLFQRFVNEYADEPLLAAVPGVVLQRLWELVAVAELALFAVSALVVLAGIVGMLTMLLASVAERRREMAVLRAVGAGRGLVFALLVTEAAVLAGAAATVGVAAVHVAIRLARDALLERFSLALSGQWPTLFELAVIGAVALIGALAAVLPAWRLYRFSLADGLSVRT